MGETGDGGFAAALGDWRGGAGPAYRRLAGAIRSAIESGAVAWGARVPAERPLANQLAVSRTTAVAAYNLLRDEGWLESRQGSGTLARVPGEARGAAGEGTRRGTPHRVSRVLVETHGDTVDFLGTHLPGLGALADRFLAAAEGSADWEGEPGYFPLGLPDLRRAIARHLSRSKTFSD
jgi:DNA-binding transcriptional MocR family regulator